MAKKKCTPEQVVSILRQIEVAVGNGETTPQACKEAHSYHDSQIEAESPCRS